MSPFDNEEDTMSEEKDTEKEVADTKAHEIPEEQLDNVAGGGPNRPEVELVKVVVEPKLHL
jgi:hypothetical protein